MSLFQIKELAPHMGPARRFDDLAAVIEMMKAGISVGLQNPTESLQMLPGMLPFAIGRVRKPHGRRRAVARRAIITNIRPQPTRLGLAPSWRQYRDRRIVGVDLRCRQHMLSQRL